jgi:AraC-like DNA-binding protein
LNEKWFDIIVTEIQFAIYVPKGSGRVSHKDRPFHGLVLNDGEGEKEYLFSDGRVLHTPPNSLFYLPKGSSYSVTGTGEGGCYAINFDAELSDEPFCINLRSVDGLQKSFKKACTEWRADAPTKCVSAKRAIYDAIEQCGKEIAQKYLPRDRYDVIAPAVETVEREFSENGLSVSRLSEICGVSEVYFRKIFFRRFGVSPKEYITRRRMEYARQLLKTGQFEVGEVARLCGYGEPCHFSREFKKRFGVSPRDCV